MGSVFSSRGKNARVKYHVEFSAIGIILPSQKSHGDGMEIAKKIYFD
jgi:hypothetical protein